MLTLYFRLFLDKTKALNRTVEELREKTWELDTSTRSKDQKLKKRKNSFTEFKYKIYFVAKSKNIPANHESKS